MSYRRSCLDCGNRTNPGEEITQGGRNDLFRFLLHSQSPIDKRSAQPILTSTIFPWEAGQFHFGKLDMVALFLGTPGTKV
jgi:hypothetical protein